MIHFASFDSIQWLGFCHLKSFRAFCVTGFFVFWSIFANWALVGTSYFISIPFDGSFWSICFYFCQFWIILLNIGPFCSLWPILANSDHWFWCIWLILMIHFGTFYSFWRSILVHFAHFGRFWQILTIDFGTFDSFWWFILVHFTHFEDPFWSIWIILVTKFSPSHFISLILVDFGTF